MRYFLLPAATALLLAIPAQAKAPAIHVEGWARAGLGQSAAYLSLHNGGSTADRLLSVSSPVAATASLHSTSMAGGVMRMRPVAAVPLAAGAAVSMKPGGLHVMLSGLKAPLRPGAKLPLRLRFEKAGTVTVSLPVLPPGASGPAGAHHGH